MINIQARMLCDLADFEESLVQTFSPELLREAAKKAAKELYRLAAKLAEVERERDRLKSDWDERMAAIERKAQKRAEDAEQEAATLASAYELLSAYAVTCQRKNTREWMFGLEDALNRAAAICCDPDRAVCGSDGMAMWVKKAAQAAGAKRA